MSRQKLERWPMYIIKQLISEDGTLFNHADIAPAPDKDYAQLVVSTSEIIFRFWRITLRKNVQALPVEKRESLDDFLYDERLQSEITRLFGTNLLVYLQGLAAGHIDYLVRMPRNLLVTIVRMLELEDVARLAQTCKSFNEICNSNELWELLYKDHTRQAVSDELHSLAVAIGWKKLFFTNKLQLQMQLRRISFIQKHASPEKSLDEQDSWDLRPASIMSSHSSAEEAGGVAEKMASPTQTPDP